MDLDLQCELFDQALAELAIDDDLINTALEVTASGGEIVSVRYRIPAP